MPRGSLQLFVLAAINCISEMLSGLLLSVIDFQVRGDIKARGEVVRAFVLIWWLSNSRQSIWMCTKCNGAWKLKLGTAIRKWYSLLLSFKTDMLRWRHTKTDKQQGKHWNVRINRKQTPHRIQVQDLYKGSVCQQVYIKSCVLLYGGCVPALPQATKTLINAVQATLLWTAIIN